LSDVRPKYVVNSFNSPTNILLFDYFEDISNRLVIKL